MFADYRARVLEDYRKKKDRNELSLNLTLSTPGKLRNECLAVLGTRYSVKDEKTLRLFFGARDSAAEYEQAIRKVDIDRFRPLNNLLSNNGIHTDEKNIELLAWLIDYQPRPYRLVFDKAQEELPAAGPEIDPADSFEETGKKPPVKEPDNLNPPGEEGGFTRLHQQAKKPLLTQRKRSVILLLFLAITGIGTYPVASNFFAPQECMYWTGSEYEAISCSKTVENTPILALDVTKLQNFKKISLTDTITRHSLGYVWYSKINNRLEFFTSAGHHPTNAERQLKPLTQYIIDKYLSEKSKLSER